MSRKKGLSFYRRRRQMQMTMIQSALLWIGQCILAFVMGCILVYYFMTSMTCIGQAMEPTMGSGNHVLVNRFGYSLMSPEAGDVIVFKPNGNVNSHYYMRRVIAVPGDRVQIRDGFVYVNDELVETAIGNEQMAFAGVASEEQKLGKDEYFVLGDNRDASEDSRNADIGNVKEKDIYGQAWFIYYPWDHFGMIK